MNTYQVAIIGAGPAGSAAAIRLAQRGIRVALFDQAKFPRDKSCGDGSSAETIVLLQGLGLGEWLKQFAEMDVLRISSPDGTIVDVPIPTPPGGCNGRTIPRRLLDNRLVQAAHEAGASLFEGVKVQGVDLSGAKPRILADGLAAEAELVILADGSHAPLTRALGLTQDTTSELLAVRQYMAGDTGPANRMEIHFQDWILPGYSWIFPLGEGRANVGTGTYTRRVLKDHIDLKDILVRFTSDPVTEGRLSNSEPAGPVKGHPLRSSFGRTRTHAERLLVVGDAAGLVNPFSGEGVAPALHSGELAAAHALNALLSGNFSAEGLAAYSRDLHTHYLADRRAGQLLRRILDIPPLLNRIFHTLKHQNDLAMLVALIIIGQKSPRLALRPHTLVRLLAG